MIKDDSEPQARGLTAGDMPVSAIIIPFPTRRKRKGRKPAQPKIELVPLNFRIESDVRRRFTRFCLDHGLPRNEALKRAFDLLRAEIEK